MGPPAPSHFCRDAGSSASRPDAAVKLATLRGKLMTQRVKRKKMEHHENRPLLGESSSHLSSQPQPFHVDCVFRVARLFSGPKKKPDSYKDSSFIFTDFDVSTWQLEEGQSCDALREMQKELQHGDYDLMVTQLPMRGMNRVQYYSSMGPKALRGRQHPFGYPWLDDKEQAEADRCTMEAAANVGFDHRRSDGAQL